MGPFLHRWLQAKGLFILKKIRVPLPALLSDVMDCCCVELYSKVKPGPVSQWGPVVSELTVSPKGFDESLHFLCFSLNTNMSLELSQGFVELHAWEIHLIHHTTRKGQTREKGKKKERAKREKRVRLGLVVVCRCNEKVSERASATNYEYSSADGKSSSYSHTSITELLTWKTHIEITCLHTHTHECAHALCANINREDRVWRQWEIRGKEREGWEGEIMICKERGGKREVHERLRTGCSNGRRTYARLCVYVYVCVHACVSVCLSERKWGRALVCVCVCSVQWPISTVSATTSAKSLSILDLCLHGLDAKRVSVKALS